MKKRIKLRKFESDLTPLSAMLAFVPLCILLEMSHADPVWIFITAGLATVSYTHLDVYKRQLHSFSSSTLLYSASSNFSSSGL